MTVKFHDDVSTELRSARAKFPAAFHSPHEGFAVLLEEVEELKAVVFGRRQDRAEMRRELVQVAAMALRFAEDVCGPVIDDDGGETGTSMIDDVSRGALLRNKKDGRLVIVSEFERVTGVPMVARSLAVLEDFDDWEAVTLGEEPEDGSMLDDVWLAADLPEANPAAVAESCEKILNEESSVRGELGSKEPHPAAWSAQDWLRSLSLVELAEWKKSISSTAIEDNRLGEVCGETLDRLTAGKLVSDRYLLGLAWTMRFGKEESNDEKR